MTDNLFDRLAELFKASGPVNWRLAKEIAESSAGPAEPIEPWIDEEYRELTATAARHIDAASPLDASAVGADVDVVDRRTWASSNVEGFGYLAEPLAAKLLSGGGAPEFLQPLGPALVGLQMGGMVGAMSQRVLAGFDVGLPSGDERPPAFLVPNIESFASDHGLDPRQLRLWVTMHEVSYGATLALPWVKEAAVMAVDRFVDSLEVDQDALEQRMEALQDPDALERLVEGGGMVGGLVAGPDGIEALDEVRTVMSIVEGYADFLIGRAIGDLVPEAGRLREALDRARAEPSQGERMLGEMIGMDLHHARYSLGTTFCDEIERRWGSESVDRIWEGAESLPKPGDLEDPVAWAARALL